MQNGKKKKHFGKYIIAEMTEDGLTFISNQKSHISIFTLFL